MRVQAKDISDERFLAAVAKVARGPMRWAMRGDVTAELGFPEKVVLAKARKLILQKKLRGCFCGCRGDFELPTPEKTEP